MKSHIAIKIESSCNACLEGIRTVFLDRDGVVNEKMPEGRYVRSWNEFRLLPCVPDAIARLNRAGKRVIVVSNQRGIALGLYTVEDVENIHKTLQDSLKSLGAHIDGFYFCPHDKDQCKCRKPLPGLYEQATAVFPDLSTTESLMIGDSLSDIEFGQRLGMITFYIEGNSEQRKPGFEKARLLASYCFPSLSTAVDALLHATS